MKPDPAAEKPPTATSPIGSPCFQPPPHIPDHELIRRIGRGSYGDVWLARSVVGTLRAVKIVRRQTFERDEHFEREFKGIQKFEPISRSHEGLVDILQIGRNEADGYFYYVMELADDALVATDVRRLASESEIPNLKSKIARSLLPPAATYEPKTLRREIQQRGRLPAHECLQIGLALADALEHLHSNDLVHRDIKPSNIILVDGASKLADIGLVAHIDDARSLVGTAGYIPPEGPGTPQADLYSLGKVLYEISLGKDRQDFPQLPPDLQSHPDHAALLELNEVTLKACETDFRKRYQSAQQMRDDLALLQDGESVKRKRVVEKRLAILKSVGLGFCALLLVAGGLWLSVGPMRKSAAAIRAKPKPEAEELYNQARTFTLGTKEGVSRAIELANQAVLADPNYAAPYALLNMTS